MAGGSSDHDGIMSIIVVCKSVLTPENLTGPARSRTGIDGREPASINYETVNRRIEFSLVRYAVFGWNIGQPK